MKYEITAMLAIGAILFCCTGAPAQPSEAKRDDIRKLMEVTGAGELGIQVMSQMLPSLKQMAPEIPDVFWTEVLGDIDVDELVELCIPSYEKHFTHAEIKELLKFYDTPLGKKMIRVQPTIMQECMDAGGQWGQEVAKKAIQRIQQYQEADK